MQSHSSRSEERRAFSTYRKIKPYFQERADWEFIESVLEATMKQRMKWERAWIVRASKGASSLADVQRNVQVLQEKAKRGMDQDMYMLLGEYLKKVVPLLRVLPKAPTVELQPGLNVMDLREYPEELQLLVISSTIRFIHQHSTGVITIIPEAWKFVPQGRNSPVKVEVRKLAREGAGLGNYIWIDSQDIAGVEKEILRSAAVWLLGVQREANEIKRALGSIPKGIKRPKEGEIPQLKLGEFFACWGEHVHRVYVQPAWMEQHEAIAIATGKAKVTPQAVIFETKRTEDDDDMYKELYADAQNEIKALKERLTKYENETRPAAPEPEKAGTREYSLEESMDAERMYQAIKERLIREAPKIISLLRVKPEIDVEVKREKIVLTTKTTKGRVAALIAEGFFAERRGNSEVKAKLAEQGWSEAPPNISNAFKDLTRMGFLRDVGGRYQEVADMKVNIVEA
jgi:hypothetical protein